MTRIAQLSHIAPLSRTENGAKPRETRFFLQIITKTIHFYTITKMINYHKNRNIKDRYEIKKKLEQLSTGSS